MRRDVLGISHSMLVAAVEHALLPPSNLDFHAASNIAARCDFQSNGSFQFWKFFWEIIKSIQWISYIRFRYISSQIICIPAQEYRFRQKLKVYLFDWAIWRDETFAMRKGGFFDKHYRWRHRARFTNINFTIPSEHAKHQSFPFTRVDTHDAVYVVIARPKPLPLSALWDADAYALHKLHAVPVYFTQK